MRENRLCSLFSTIILEFFFTDVSDCKYLRGNKPHLRTRCKISQSHVDINFNEPLYFVVFFFLGSDFQTPFFFFCIHCPLFLSEFHLVTVKIWRQIDEGDKFWQKFEKNEGAIYQN